MTELTQEHRTTKLEAAMAELARLTGDHEKRLRKLEVRIGYGLGVVGGVLFVLEKFKVI